MMDPLDGVPPTAVIHGTMRLDGYALRSLLSALADKIDANGEFTVRISIVKHVEDPE